MDIVTLLSVDSIAFEPDVSSKKRAFEKLASLLSQEDKDRAFMAEKISNLLFTREKLGCTALGNGIAIPHASIHPESAINIDKPKAALLILNEGINMDAPDKKPTHILFALLVPEDYSDIYCDTIRSLTISFNRKELSEKLLELNTGQEVIDYLSSCSSIQDIAA